MSYTQEDRTCVAEKSRGRKYYLAKETTARTTKKPTKKEGSNFKTQFPGKWVELMRKFHSISLSLFFFCLRLSFGLTRRDMACFLARHILLFLSCPCCSCCCLNSRHIFLAITLALVEEIFFLYHRNLSPGSCLWIKRVARSLLKYSTQISGCPLLLCTPRVGKIQSTIRT